jgi:hypothetical protein
VAASAAEDTFDGRGGQDDAMSPAVRVARRVVVAAAVALACLVFAAPRAGADADPASDTLLIQDTFFPYQPLVSSGPANALNQVVAEAKAASFPIKVALIATPSDLGGLPNYYGQPQRYAQFLDREISYNAPVKLLVVMQQGFGTAGVGQPGELNPLLPVNPNPGSDGLANAAIAAVEKLAGDAGHTLAPVKVAASSGKSGGGTSALVFAAPVVLVVIAALGVAVVRRRQRDEDEEGAESA